MQQCNPVNMVQMETFFFLVNFKTRFKSIELIFIHYGICNTSNMLNFTFYGCFSQPHADEAIRWTTCCRDDNVITSRRQLSFSSTLFRIQGISCLSCPRCEHDSTHSVTSDWECHWKPPGSTEIEVYCVYWQKRRCLTPVKRLATAVMERRVQGREGHEREAWIIKKNVRMLEPLKQLCSAS